MMLVNNPGNWSRVFESLTHADWNGCTLADLVFPFFIFILGAAMPFAFGQRIEQGQQRRDLYLRIARRSASLIALGLMLNAAAAPAIIAFRIPGVLQRLGIVYLLAAPMVIHARPAWRAVTLAALVIGHWALLLVPLGGAPAGFAQADHLAGFIDQAAFGRHILTPTGDPEGILGTLPATGSVLLASVAGDWLRQDLSASARVGGLIIGGLAAVVLGLTWSCAATE
jgi:predicted acyltransferase